MENASVLTTAHTITHLSAINISGYTYRIDLQVNGGGNPVETPDPVYDPEEQTIIWNLSNVSSGQEANGNVTVDFAGYHGSEKAIISFIIDGAGTKITKGGVVINQTDFPPFLPFPNYDEISNLFLESFTLNKNGTIYTMYFSFSQGAIKYKEAKTGGVSLTGVVNLGGFKALDIRVVNDNTVTGNLDINYEVSIQDLNTHLAFIPTSNPLLSTSSYHKWGAVYLDV